MTSCPSDWSTAAATDESTPPLIITSTRAIMRRRRRRRCCTARGITLERGVDVGVGGRVAEAEPHRCPTPGPPGCPSPSSTCDGSMRARRARGARRRAQAELVERDEQRLGLDAGERAVEDPGDAARRVAVRDEARRWRSGGRLRAGRAARRCAPARRRAARRSPARPPRAPPRPRRSACPLAAHSRARRRRSGARARRRRAPSAPPRPSGRRSCARRSTRGLRPAAASRRSSHGRAWIASVWITASGGARRARARRPRRAAARCRSRC